MLSSLTNVPKRKWVSVSATLPPQACPTWWQLTEVTAPDSPINTSMRGLSDTSNLKITAASQPCFATPSRWNSLSTQVSSTRESASVLWIEFWRWPTRAIVPGVDTSTSMSMSTSRLGRRGSSRPSYSMSIMRTATRWRTHGRAISSTLSSSAALADFGRQGTSWTRLLMFRSTHTTRRKTLTRTAVRPLRVKL